VKNGYTNYAAAYCTGLLLARRINNKYKLKYEGKVEADGEDFEVEADPEDKAPFKALLDVGLARTTTGARVFGALKGAVDGGLNVPHNGKRFPGTEVDGKEVKTNPETHKKYITAGHVAEYMKKLQEVMPPSLSFALPPSTRHEYEFDVRAHLSPSLGFALGFAGR
jgi:large subunit ribosomal protein L5e